MLKKIFELGEEQVGKLAQQLMSNERFINAVQAVVTNSLKAKGMLDKHVRLALSAANLPSIEDVDNLRKKIEELEDTVRRLEENVSKSPTS
jgi:polyhydroxyalkanoate synthesis regulator phasin